MTSRLELDRILGHHVQRHHRAGSAAKPCAATAQYARAGLSYVAPMKAELDQVDGRSLIGPERRLERSRSAAAIEVITRV